MTPKLAALLPVEDVLQSLALPDKRLTLHRMFFDLYAPTFPANAILPVVLVLCGGSGTFSISAALVDPAGREVARDISAFTASAMHTQLLTLRGVLPMAGEYRLVGKIEEAVVADLPLVVATTKREGE